MTFSELIGSPTESIEYKYARPRRYACPECGKRGKRQWVISSRSYVFWDNGGQIILAICLPT